VKVVRPGSAEEFLAGALPLLMQREAENGLMIAVAEEAVLAPRTAAGAYWAVALDGRDATAAALRTTDKLLLSHEARAGGAAALARDAAAIRPLSVLGPGDAVSAFTRELSSLTGVVWGEGRRQRIYELRRVVPPPTVAGRCRLADASDRDLVLAWVVAFTVEALGEMPDESAVAARWDPRVERGTVYLWEREGDVVSMAAAVGPTPNGMRVGAVYTPPEHRGHGYASALVAALSQDLLDRGRTFTMLYTDLANPTSNAIYQRIGYVPVSDPLELRVIGSD
jgi:predicted GNAT family acetyltransferase